VKKYILLLAITISLSSCVAVEETDFTIINNSSRTISVVTFSTDEDDNIQSEERSLAIDASLVLFQYTDIGFCQEDESSSFRELFALDSIIVSSDLGRIETDVFFEADNWEFFEANKKRDECMTRLEFTLTDEDFQ